MKVYLSGTITADPRTHFWRQVAEEALVALGHVAVSPLRRKDASKFTPDGLSSGDTSIPPSLFVARDE